MAGELQPGMILGNRYEIVEKIGEGGMAIVYKAKCRLLNRFVGIKVLRNEFIEDAEFLSKFNIESQAAASLSHQNIVSIYDVGVEGDVNYIVMEYVEGITLKQYISKKGALSWQEAAAFSIQICSALEHAHKNHIIHRDIKPQNIILTSEGVLKVTDFGIARATTASTVRVGGALGSVHYSSPEQARGTYTDEKTDIYSLGIVMYEMLTGRVPFQADTPVSIALMHMEKQPAPISLINPNVPKYVEAIVSKAMSKEIISRFENSTLLLNALRQALKNPNSPSSAMAGAASVTNSNDNNTGSKPIPPAMENYPSRPNAPSNKYADDDYDNDDDFDDDDNYRNEKPMKKKKKKRATAQDKIAVWASVITVLVVLTIGTIFAWPWLAPMFGLEVTSGENIKLPKIVGMDKVLAQKTIEDLGLKFEIDTSELSAEYDKDQITYQNPEADMEVKAKSTVKVRISLGKESIKTPSLVNKDQVVAISTLEKLGLVPKIMQEVDNDLAAGVVIRQSPEADADISVGDEVTIYVNSRSSDEITMVSLKGLSLNKATEKLDELGLILGDVTRDFSDLPIDTVIRQSISANALVLKKNLVDLVLSKGPKEESPSTTPTNSPSTTPTNSPSDTPTNSPSSSPKPPEKTTKTLVINVPQNSDSTVIKVVANGKTIYEEEVSKDKGSVGINVKGSGTATVEVYFNNEYQLTKIIDFTKE